MPSTWIIKSIGMIIVSFLVGGVFYYLTSTNSSEQKRKQLEEVLSLLINFVIFIWIGKVVLNVSAFMSDPLAILAYPSNASAFYLATLFLLINIGYRVWKHQFNVLDWLYSFVPVLLAATFTYEFIQFIEIKSKHGLIQVIFLMVLLIGFLILKEKFRGVTLAIMALTVWALGQFILSLTIPVVTFFGYTMKPWFNLSLMIIFIVFTFYSKRKKVL